MFNIICLTISILCGLSFIEMIFPQQKILSRQLYQLTLLITFFLVVIKFYFGPDIMIYVPMYETIQSPLDILTNTHPTKYEKGFLLYCAICNHWLHLNFWGMTAIITVIYFVAINLILRQLPAFKTFALFTIILLQTNLIFFEYRQCLAVSFFIFSIIAFNKKKYILYILFTAFAIFTHKSAPVACIISLAGLMLYNFKEDNSLFAVSLLFLIIFIAIPLKSLLLSLSNLLPLSADVLNSIQDHLIIERRIQVIFIIYILVIYSLYLYFYKSNKLKTWHIITFCGLLLIALFYQYWFFINRLRSYFVPFISAYVITICYNSYNKNLMIKQLAILAVYLLFAINLKNMYIGNGNLKSGVAETSTIFKLYNESEETIKKRNLEKAKQFWLTEYIGNK